MGLITEFLLNKGYEVHGIKEEHYTIRIDHLYQAPHEIDKNFILSWNLTDSTSLIRIINEIQPDEIYNLASKSLFILKRTEYTTNSDAIRHSKCKNNKFLKLEKKTKYYQASTTDYMETLRNHHKMKVPFIKNLPMLY